MTLIIGRQQRAGLLIFILGAGLIWATWPYFSGLLGAPVLYVIFGSLHRRLARKIGAPGGAIVVIIIAFLVIFLPVIGAVGLLANEAQDWASVVKNSELLGRLSTLQVGDIKVGEQLSKLSSSAVSWLGGNALGVLGTGAKLLVQFTLTFFGLYYVLVQPEESRKLLESFIPFSQENRERLIEAFRNVTVSMLIGTFLTAALQGTALGLGFWALGLPSPAFWGVVTVIFAVLPLVGSGMIWGPAAAYLAFQGRPLAAAALVAGGVLIVGNIDTLVRPFVFQRYAKMHPFVTVIGAFAFVPIVGILGLLVGPLAISYFFELVRMYRGEYLQEPAISVPDAAALEAAAAAAP
jgi:predicted PurR-regulated permease PerM